MFTVGLKDPCAWRPLVCVYLFYHTAPLLNNRVVGDVGQIDLGSNLPGSNIHSIEKG